MFERSVCVFFHCFLSLYNSQFHCFYCYFVKLSLLLFLILGIFPFSSSVYYTFIKFQALSNLITLYICHENLLLLKLQTTYIFLYRLFN